jgi:hypothetical protein
LNVEHGALGLRAFLATEEFLGGAEAARLDAGTPQQQDNRRAKGSSSSMTDTHGCSLIVISRVAEGNCAGGESTDRSGRPPRFTR